MDHLEHFPRGRSICRPCVNAGKRAWYSANKEKHQVWRKVWAERNADTLREHRRLYHLTNLERDRERSRLWGEKNADLAASRTRKWHRDNPEKRRAYLEVNAERRLEQGRAYNRAHRQEAREYSRQWRLANPDRHRLQVAARRARLLSATVDGVSVTVEALEARWAMWGQCCYVCGDDATETDHVIPLTRGGLHVPANLRPICKPCNCSKYNREWRPFVVAA